MFALCYWNTWNKATMVRCVYLGMEDTLGLQNELVVVVWLVQNVFESKESYRTHGVPILPENTDLQLTSLLCKLTCTK